MDIQKKYEILSNDHKTALNRIKILEKLLGMDFNHQTINKKDDFVWIKINNPKDYNNLMKTVEQVNNYMDNAHIVVCPENIDSISTFTKERLKELGIQLVYEE